MPTYTRPVTYVDGDQATPLTAARLHQMQDGVAAYADSIVGTGSVVQSPAATQTILPSTVNVSPLNLQAHASSSAATTQMASMDSDGSTKARLLKEGTLDVFTGNIIFPSYRAFNATTDTQPSFYVAGSDVRVGAGGTTAPDIALTRNATYADPYGVTAGTGITRPALKVGRASGNNSIPVLMDAARIVPSASTTINSLDMMPLYLELNQSNSSFAAGLSTIKAFSIYTKTDGNATTPYTRGIESYTQFGSGSQVSSGTGHAFTGVVIVQGATAGSEHAVYFGQLSYDTINGSRQGGRAWFTDWAMHSDTVQQSLLSGVNFVINNRYNGSPAASPSYGFGMMTSPNASAGGGHPGGTTYPVDVGFWVGGQSNGTDGVGYYSAFKIGMGNHPRTGAALGNAFGWNFGAATVATGIDIDDYTKYAIHVGARQMPGSGVGPQAIRTETTAGPSYFRGGLAVDTGGGAPSGTRYSPMADGLLYADSTTGFGRLWVYLAGAWRYINVDG